MHDWLVKHMMAWHGGYTHPNLHKNIYQTYGTIQKVKKKKTFAPRQSNQWYIYISAYVNGAVVLSPVYISCTYTKLKTILVFMFFINFL